MPNEVTGIHVDPNLLQSPLREVTTTVPNIFISGAGVVPTLKTVNVYTEHCSVLRKLMSEEINHIFELLYGKSALTGLLFKGRRKTLKKRVKRLIRLCSDLNILEKTSESD